MGFKHPRAIKIAGAGPAGLTAAICLAKAGHPVELFEAKTCVGGRFIGDFQVIENAGFQEDVIQMLDHMGIQTNFFFKPVSEAVFYDHHLRPKQVKSQQPFGYFILRGSENESLDMGLLAQARDAGAEICFGRRMKKEAVDLVATGPAVADGLAKEMTFSTGLPDTVSVLFDMNVSPGGYSYLFVLDGRATFGCAITRDFDGIKTCFERALERFQYIAPFSIHDPKYGYSYMNFCLKSSAVDRKNTFIGEAGGFQDYLFGLGIRYAMKTGYAAAQSILQHKNYDTLWKKEVGQAQETSLVNRYLYEAGGNRGLSSFVKRAGRGDLQTYLKKWHRPAPWKRLLLPWIKRFWKTETRCFHRLPEHWCREKPSASAQTPLGPEMGESGPSKIVAVK
ncbi:MAG: NAD(P)/FAD-dependent oxidoreductase [Nitrospiria bacterium]